MAVIKEFTVLMEDRPGTLGKVCRALADRNVNVLALHSFPIGGKSVTRFVVDNPTAAKTALDKPTSTSTTRTVAWSPARIHRSFSLVSTKSPKRLHSWNKPPPLPSHRLQRTLFSNGSGWRRSHSFRIRLKETQAQAAGVP